MLPRDTRLEMSSRGIAGHNQCSAVQAVGAGAEGAHPVGLTGENVGIGSVGVGDLEDGDLKVGHMGFALLPEELLQLHGSAMAVLGARAPSAPDAFAARGLSDILPARFSIGPVRSLKSL